jgi:hypothetical protein
MHSLHRGKSSQKMWSASVVLKQLPNGQGAKIRLIWSPWWVVTMTILRYLESLAY